MRERESGCGCGRALFSYYTKVLWWKIGSWVGYGVNVHELWDCCSALYGANWIAQWIVCWCCGNMGGDDELFGLVSFLVFLLLWSCCWCGIVNAGERWRNMECRIEWETDGTSCRHERGMWFREKLDLKGVFFLAIVASSLWYIGLSRSLFGPKPNPLDGFQVPKY